MNKLSLSFRNTLILLIWSAALIPAVYLSVRNFDISYQRLNEANNKKLVSDAVIALSNTRQQLKASITALDEMAIEGSIIASASMDTMSVRALTKMESFLKEQPMFSSIMIIAPDLFQTEAIPSKSLLLDLTPFNAFLTDILTSSSSIYEPQARYISVPRKLVDPNYSEGEDYVFGLARPILKPKESLTQPFEVVSVLFAIGSAKDVVTQLLSGAKVELADIQLEVAIAQQVIFSNMLPQWQNDHFVYQDQVVFGENDPFDIKVGFSEKLDLTVGKMLHQEKRNFIITLVLLIMLLLGAAYLTRRIVRPVFELKSITEQFAQSDFLTYKAFNSNYQSVFKEFNEVYRLLRNMSTTITEQFNQLSTKNFELETSSNALRASVTEGEQHHQMLNELMHFSLKIQNATSIEKVGQLTIKVLFLLVESPVGLVLYRTENSAGFSSIERSPSAFQNYINNHKTIHLTQEQITASQQQQQEFQLEAIIIDNVLRGYLIYRAPNLSGFSLRALNMLVMILRSYMAQRDLRYKLEIQANTDALTGLSNRHFFDNKFVQRVEQFNKQSVKTVNFAVIVIDINGLKKVNDSLGHAAGDLLIESVAQVLRGIFRKSDVISRVGGDEFIVLLSDVSSAQCHEWLTAILAHALEKKVDFQGRELEVSFSCGFSCTDTTPPEQLINKADKAMYKHKVEHSKNYKIKRLVSDEQPTEP